MTSKSKLAALALALLPASVASAQVPAPAFEVPGFPGVPRSSQPGADHGCLATLQAAGQGLFDDFGPRVEVCPDAVLIPPADWYAGDIHEHVQFCFSVVEPSEAQVLAEMIGRGLSTASILVWGGNIDPNLYVNSYINRITGAEDPASTPNPTRFIQYGVEVSGFDGAKLGHVIGLNIRNQDANIFQGWGCPSNDGSGDYPKPILDMFQQGPESVTAYAHQSWSVALHAPAAAGGFDWENPVLPAYLGADAVCSTGLDMAFPDPVNTIIHPTLGAIDVAMGRIEVLESVEMRDEYGINLEDRWYGMYYKLLSAGLRVSIGAGTDGDCVFRGRPCEPRTWVRLPDGDPLDYDAWTENLEEGRVSIATGSHQLLDLDVDGELPGGQVELSSPMSGMAEVTVEATYHAASGVNVRDAIEIVVDGEVVFTEAFELVDGGTHSVQVLVPIPESTWVAARTRSLGTHTGATYVILDAEPIADCQTAEYWTIYCDYLNWIFDTAAAFPDPAVLEAWVGCSETEIRDYIADGRAIFAALRDFAAGPPPNTSRLGRPSSAFNALPMGIGVNATPEAGAMTELHCFNAPAESTGVLLLGTEYSDEAVNVNGANLYLLDSLDAWYEVVPADTNLAGFARNPIHVAESAEGAQVYAQYIWIEPAQTGSGVSLSASGVLAFTVQ